MPENFKESLEANLKRLSASVLLDHESEVRRLNQTIEELKNKLEHMVGKSMQAEGPTASSLTPAPGQLWLPAQTSPVHGDKFDLDGDCSECSSERSSTLGDVSDAGMDAVCCMEPKATYGSISKVRRNSSSSDRTGPGSHRIVLPGAVKRRFSNGFQEACGAIFKRRNSAPIALTSLSWDMCTSNLPQPVDGQPLAPAAKSNILSSEEPALKLAPAWCKGWRYSSRKPLTMSNISMDSNASSTNDYPGSPTDKASENCVNRFIRYIMVQPSSIKYAAWNVCGLALIFHDTVVVPLEIFGLPDSAFLNVLVASSTSFWTLDIVGHFITGHMHADGSVTMNPAAVAFKYASSWLVFDTCMVICNWALLLLRHPANSQEDGIHGLNVWRTLTLVRVLRILRLFKAPEMEGFISEHIRSETTRLVVSITRLITLLMIVAHFIACSWYGVGRYVASQGNDSSWVVRYNLAHEDLWDKYAFSVHWSLSQFTGEQIIQIESISERSFAIGIFIFAFLFSSIFVSSITTLMTRLQIIASKQSGQLSSLRRYLHDNGISTSLAVRIIRNAQQAMRTNQRIVALHSVEVLQEVSRSLKIELHFEVHFPTISSHPFFKCYYAANPIGMQKLCHQAVSVHWLSVQDVVFHECETPEKPAMLFVTQGQLVYHQEGVQKYKILSRGTWACEAALWLAVVQHHGTMRVTTESSLLRLEADLFQRMVVHFPTHHAQEYAKQFLHRIRILSIEEDSTDVPDLDADYICELVFPDMYLDNFAMAPTTRSVHSTGIRPCSRLDFFQHVLSSPDVR